MLAPPQVSAQSLQEVKDSLTLAYRDIHEQEIPIRGAIGTVYGDTLYFMDSTGHYPIVLDAGRAARRSLEGCEINPFLDADRNPCQISGMAEIEVDWKDSENLADGFKTQLIVFELTLDKLN